MIDWLKHSKYFLVGLISLATIACGGEEKAQQAVQNLAPEQVYEIIREKPDVVIIDVRTPAEFQGRTGHIKNAQLKPVNEIKQWASEIDSLKEKQIILVCAVGGRSGYAAKFLKNQGFKHLINMKGGMMAWNSRGLPVERPTQ